MIKVWQSENYIFIWLLKESMEFAISRSISYRRGNKRIRLSLYALRKFNIGYKKISDQYARDYLELKRPYSDYVKRIDFKELED